MGSWLLQPIVVLPRTIDKTDDYSQHFPSASNSFYCAFAEDQEDYKMEILCIPLTVIRSREMQTSMASAYFERVRLVHRSMLL